MGAGQERFVLQESGDPAESERRFRSLLDRVADEVLPHLGRIPKSVSGRPLAWLGAYGLEPMAREVAKFLNLFNQSGAVAGCGNTASRRPSRACARSISVARALKSMPGV